MKEKMYDIALWYFVIIGMVACIGGLVAIMYLIWFLAPFHWSVKIFLTLTSIMAFILGCYMAESRTECQRLEINDKIQKFIKEKNYGQTED